MDVMFPTWEVGPIRPPSEASSLLIRVTRNCPWNKCEFCPIYKRETFELRPVEDILEDIDAAACCGQPFATAFLQDANSLVMKTPDLVRVLEHLKAKIPSIERITSYARARTAARKSVAELVQLREAGLSRLHIGLESGYDALLEFMKKGVTSDLAIEAGRRIKEAKISLCFYVILGLGGRLILEGEPAWKKHALETARVLNAVDPAHIRVRTLATRPGAPLYERMMNGEFHRASDALVVAEEKLLVENLEVTSRFVSDHVTNILMEVEGQLPEDKGKMLDLIREYLALSSEEQLNFRLGTLFRYSGYAPSYRSFTDFLSSSHRPELTAVIEDMEAKEPGSAQRLLEQLSARLV